jgi:hypothetical protein
MANVTRYHEYSPDVPVPLGLHCRKRQRPFPNGNTLSSHHGEHQTAYGGDARKKVRSGM